MMTNQRWLPLLAFVFLLGILLHIPFLVSLALSLVIVLALANWWRNQSLAGVSYQRKFHYIRAFPGEKIPLRIEVENRKILPLSWLRVQDPWPRAVGPDDEEILAPSHVADKGFLTNVFSFRWFERSRRFYTLVFRKRGVYQVGPARLDSGDLFGFYEQAREDKQVEYLTVFPSLTKLPPFDYPAEDPFGDRRSRRRLYEDPNRPMGVREYHPEDGFRRVHWPATAHTGQLQVKVYQPTSSRVMVVCLNASTYVRHWEGVYPELLEHLIRVAATIIYEGIQDGYRVGLISNGCLAHADQPFRIPPGRSPNQLGHLMEALAGVTSVVTAPFDRYLMREAPRVPYGSFLTIITAVMTPDLAQTLIQLKRHERQMVLISLAEHAPTEIPGVKIVHLPFQGSPPLDG